LPIVIQPNISDVQADTREDEYVFLRSWGGEGDRFGNIFDVVVGSDGTVYATVSNLDRIMKIQPVSRTIQIWGGRGAEPGLFEYPFGIAVDASDNVYVVDHRNSRIQKYSSDGDYLSNWVVFIDQAMLL
jgi:DNA-binding beta-propeller fold protein YncE